MRLLGAVWLMPLAIHLGYAIATYSHLPSVIGTGPGDPGTPLQTFAFGWAAITGAANFAFVFLYVRLPHFSPKDLRVPGQSYWLATPERKADLIERLRGICETALFSLNLFFAAVYQAVYQANAHAPFMTVPFPALITFFMALPILGLTAILGLTVAKLAKEARKSNDN